MKLEAFQRAYLLRKSQTLINSRFLVARELTLPLFSALHHITEDTVTMGISGKHPLVVGYTGGEKRVSHINTLTDKEPMIGTFRKVPLNVKKLETQYFRQQPDMRRVIALDKIIESRRALVICDYTMLLMGSIYSEQPMKLYNEWHNLRTTMFATMKDIGHLRTNFFMVKMPNHLPELADFNMVKDGIGRAQADKWLSHESLDLAMIYQFVHGHGPLAQRSKEELESMIITFYHKGLVCFIRPSDLVNLEEKDAETTGLKVYDFFKRFMVGVSAAEEQRTENSVENAAEKAEDAKEASVATGDSETNELGNYTVELDSVEDLFEFELPKGVNLTVEQVEELKPIIEQVAQLGEAHQLTAAEQKRLLQVAAEMANLGDPFGTGMTISKTIELVGKGVNSPVSNTIPTAIDNIIDETLTKSVPGNFRTQYRDTHLGADVNSMLLKMKDAGILITDISTVEVKDAQSNYVEYRVAVQPLNGKKSTVTFQLPKIRDDGTFVVSGVQMTMDSQKFDVPIRKTHHNRTVLSSYFGKTFVERSEKAVDNYSRWLQNQITKIALDANDGRVSNVRFGKNPITDDKLPIAYTGVASRFSRFTANGFEFNWVASDREDFFGKDNVKKYEERGQALIAKAGTELLLLDYNNDVYRIEKTGTKTPVGRIEDIIGIASSAPRDMATITVFSRKVPVAIFMSYLMGFEKFLRYTKVKYRTVPSGNRFDHLQSDIIVKLKDDTLIIDGSDPVNSLIFAGFRQVREVLKTVRLDQLNKKITYQVFDQSLRTSVHHWREIDLMYQLFLDPITVEILEYMKEPTEYYPLIMRAVDLITDDRFPEETDTDYVRFRGYERFAGAVYKAMVDATRGFVNNGRGRTASIDVNPKSVMLGIISDQSVQLHEDLNPIHILKEQEAVNLGGVGGRDAKTLVKKSRAYNKKDLGVISESTPDSGKVAIRTYFTPNAKLTNLRGMTERFKEGDPASSAISTAALLYPGTNNDDAKRVNLTSVQLSAMVAAEGYQAMPLRTGMEQVIGARAPDEYAYTMKEDGVVESVSKDKLIIKTEKGKIGVELGTRHGKAAGVVFPHQTVTDLKVGDTVKVGDIVAWDSGFFERDWMNPRNVEFKIGVLTPVVLMENSKTFEDSCVISPKIATLMQTGNTKAKTIVLNFDREIHDLVKVGEEVDLDTPLCVIQDSALSDFDQDESLSALKRFANNAPKAKFIGKVTRIEVMYIGNPEEASATIKDIIAADTKLRTTRNKTFGLDESPTGEVKAADTFVNGQKIISGQVAITIYMDSVMPMGAGDKGAFAAQLKTVVAGIISENTRTESGDPIGAIFSYRSIMDRIVLSAEKMGIVNRASVHHTANAVKLYRKLKGE